MKTVQIVIDEETLREADREAKRAKTNRSDLVRRALRDYLRRRRIHDLEERHRAAYERIPERQRELGPWDAVQAWPED